MRGQPNEILTTEEVAAYPKGSKRTGLSPAAHGKAPSFKLGGRFRFRRGGMGRWVGKTMVNDDEGEE